MKNTLYILFLIAFLGACTDGFDEINTDPNSPTVATVDPVVLFSQTQKDATFTAHLHQRIHNLSVDAFAQYYNPGDWGISRGSVNDGFATDYWNDHFKWINALNTIIRNTAENDDRSNLNNIARIYRVWVFHRATDLFGMIPYFDAASADAINPDYDEQEAIYTDMLKELKEAVAALDADKNSIAEYDFIYNGNVDSWKKLGNSLRLRLAMRISNVLPQVAQQHAEEAVSGGVIENNESNAKMQNWAAGWGQGYSTKYYFDWGPGNGCGMSTSMYNLLVGLGGTNFPDASFFKAQFRDGEEQVLNTVPEKCDPRGPYFFGISNQNGSQLIDGFEGNWTSIDVGIDSDEFQKEEHFIANNSRVGPAMHLDITRPLLLFTASEAYFLRCEGIINSWDMDGTIDELYAMGIEKSMESWGIEQDVVSDYLVSTNENLFGTTVPLVNNSGTNDEAIDKVMTQKYIAGFPDNGWEAWADIRRIGKPSINGIVTPDPGTGLVAGDFVQRLRYPMVERNINEAKYNAAVQKQGEDLVSTKIWWAK